MKTEHLLARELKEMMGKTPLDSISVMELSKKCNVSRKTFYYHFRDIYDLLTLVFLDERINKIEQVEDMTSLYGCVFKYYLKNEDFIDATLESAGKDLFNEFIYNNVYQTLMRMGASIDKDNKLSSNDLKAIVRFYSSAITSSMIYYLSNARNKTLEGFIQTTSFLDKDFLEKAIKKNLEMETK